MHMHPFLMATLGGVLIGAAAVLLMAVLGRIAGISGIAGGLITGGSIDRAWRLAFLIGLLLAPLLLVLLRQDSGIGLPQVSWPWMAFAGLLVGMGTGLGSGCTSGHGVCGVAGLSPRSLLATALFIVSGIATVYVMHHLVRGNTP
jgi:uncharacterized protein